MTLNTLYTFLISPAMVTAAGLLSASPAVSCSAFAHPCEPKLSRAFRHRSYGPDIFYPFGEDLRLTIHSAAEQAPATSDPTTPNLPPALDTVRAMYAALRSCWVPPLEEQARPGMEMTVRFALKRDGEMIALPRVTYATRGVSPETRDIYFNAIMDALHRCTPLPLTEGLAGEIAGVPIAVRFVDDRKRQSQ